MSTGTELSTLLTTYLHNDVGISSADKLIYLNLGVKRILRDAPECFLKKEATLAIDSSKRTYSLATDFYMMYGVWLQAVGTKLQPVLAGEWIDTVERIVTIPSGPPLRYTILGFDESLQTPAWQIRIDKTPDANYTLNYWYFPVPVTITGSSTPGLSAMGFDELICWAAAMIALQPKDPEGHQLAKQNYVENLMAFREFRAMGPDYTPVFRLGFSEGGSNLTLGDHFPSE